MPLTTIALVDDNALFRNALEALIKKFKDFQVILLAANGRDLRDQLISGSAIPDIALIDMQMPEMDGYATVAWINDHYPQIKSMILSASDDEKTVLKMIHAGIKGYVLKDSNPDVLRTALDNVRSGEFHYPAFVTRQLLKHIKETVSKNEPLELRERDIEFLKLAASDLTYKEIAHRMDVGVRTVDGYRDQLFNRYGVKSRVGLVIFALKNRLIEL